MDITFETVTVKTKSGRELLCGVSGIAAAGTFTSLMGASGSGKTTLLSTLSRRFESTLSYSGNIRYNGRKWSTNERRTIAFVQQDDIVPTYLTVEQHLEYSSRLRLNIPEEDRKARVERVIDQLRLNKCRGTVIGGPSERGISGGERKRTSIANELLTEPQVLFTDEPTSGLDSTLSSVVVEILSDLAKVHGLTVVTTIHSPSSNLFDFFDSLIVLDEGNVFYRGKAKELVSFLSNSMGKIVPPNFNPADFLMDVLVLDKARKTDPRCIAAMQAFENFLPEEEKRLNRSLPTATNKVQQDTDGPTRRKVSAARSARKLVRNVSVIFRPGEDAEEEKSLSYAQSFPMQVYLLTSRLWQNNRKEILTKNQIASTLGLAIISSLLFFQLGYSESEIFSRVSLSLWLVGTDMYLGVFSSVFAFHQEVPLLKKELYDGSYSLAAHVIAKQLVLYPNSGIWSLVFCILVLGCSKLTPSVGAAVLAILVVQMALFLFQGVGFLISAGVPEEGTMVVSVVAVTYFFAFNGFFQPFALMAAWYRWLRYPCMLTYSFQLVLRLVFPTSGGPEYTCLTPSAFVTCANGTTVITGSDVLEQYNVDMSAGLCIGVLLGCGFAIRVLAYIVLARRMTPPKGLSESNNWRSVLRKRFCKRSKAEESKVESPNQPSNGKLQDDDETVQVV